MSYRVEISKTSRAGCSATHCKKEGTKIMKGELRQGVMVPFQETQSWKWRHWGCVTPQVLHNWKETSNMDMELVDGYDELPEAGQEKVKLALEEVHVDDDDWNGDIECNRHNPDKKSQGMFVKTPKKKAKDVDDDDEAEASPTKKQATKKRNRAKQTDEDEDEAKLAPKKAKGRPKKAAIANDVDAEPAEPAPAKKGRKGKKATDEIVDEAEAVPAANKPRAKKAKSTPKVDSDGEGAPAAEEPAPAKKTRAKKSKATATNDVIDDDEVPKAQPTKRKGRGKKAAAAAED